jgi:alkylation response protein AidB-like acyl-CoA dehydrogenase
MPFTSESAEELRDIARQFVAKECNEWKTLVWDEQHHYPKDVFDTIAQLGWFGIGIPEADGGSGGSALDLVVLCEELGRGSTDLVACLSLTTSGARTIIAGGTDEQRAELIPQLMNGTKRTSISISEPDSGSDSASLKARGDRVDEHTWVLNGQKTWCEAAGHPGTLIQVFVRTDHDAPKHRGITMFLVDNETPGLDLRRLPTIGRNITGVWEVFLDGVEVPQSAMVGPENGAWRMLAAELPLERLVIAAGFIGATLQVLDDVLDHVKERHQFGQPVGNFQGVAHPIVDLCTRAEAIRLLIYEGARMHDAGLECVKEASMAKLASSELYAEVARQAVLFMGGYGYIREHPLTMHLADSAIAPVAGGPSQIMRNLVARSLGLRP